MKNILVIIWLLCIGFGLTQAQNYDSLFHKANAAYDNEFYLEAIDSYMQVLDLGYESASLYYNIGNACFKLEDYPSAILYYEKAKRISPNNEDILNNLSVANTKIVDKIEPVPELFFKKWWRAFYNMFSTDTWAGISVGGFMLFFILLAFYLLSRFIRIRKIAFYTGMVIFALTFFTFLVSLQKYKTFHNEKEAIIFIPTITVKSSPNPNSVDLFVIHEGSKVEIKDQVGEWYEIRIANGSVGWLPASSLRKI